MTTLPSMTVAEAIGSIPEVIAARHGERVLERSLSAAGLPADISSKIGHYVPEIAVNRMLDTAAQSIGDDLFGLTFTDHLSVEDYGAWGDYVLQGPTLADALRRATSIIHLHADNDRLEVRVGATTTSMEYTFAERAAPGYRHVALAALGPMLSIPRHFKGPNWRPAWIGLDFGAGRATSRLEDDLGTQVRCGEPCISLAIPNEDLSAPNPRVPADWTTRHDVERACKGGPPRDLVPFVEQLIIQGLGTKAATLEDVAWMMSVSTRTLQRQLDREGSSF